METKVPYAAFLLLDNFIRKNNVPSQKDKRGQPL